MSTTRRIVPAMTATALALPLTATGVTPTTAASAADAEPTATQTAAVTASAPKPPTSPTRVASFRHPTRIHNRFFPVAPGTQYRYSGSVTEGGTSTPHTVLFTVSHLTKKIHGVTTRVVWERDLSGKTLEEAELAFFAQDDRGRVWNFGEYPEEYEDGRLTGAPSTWITGLAGARGGLHMLAHPSVHSRPYAEGLVPAIRFYDVSRVAATKRRTCVPVRCYRNVLIVNETSPLEPDSGVQVKYYAPGVGLVRVSSAGGDSQERLRLTSVTKLKGAARRAVDRAVRRMDRRGHRVSAVYSRTRPVH
jgi:hypothetical protein